MHAYVNADAGQILPSLRSLFSDSLLGRFWLLLHALHSNPEYLLSEFIGHRNGLKLRLIAAARQSDSMVCPLALANAGVFRAGF